MRKQLLFLVIALTMIGLVGAYDLGKQNTFIDYKKPCLNNGTYCSVASTCTLTLYDPSNNVLVNKQSMTYQDAYFNYSIGNLTDLGIYTATMQCDDNGLNGAETFYLKITGNGKEEAGTGVIVLFILGFIIIMFFLVYMIIYSLGHFITFDFDLIDMAYNLGIYFSLFAFYMLGEFYLGNPQISEWLVWILDIGAITHVLVPFIALMVSIVVGSLQKKKLALNAPRIKFRGGL